MTAKSSTQRGIEFRARRKAAREALIAQGLLVPVDAAAAGNRMPADRAAAKWSGVRFDAAAPREQTEETRASDAFAARRRYVTARWARHGRPSGQGDQVFLQPASRGREPVQLSANGSAWCGPATGGVNMTTD